MLDHHLLFHFHQLRLEGPAQEPLLYQDQFGPFPKSIHTYKLEELCRRLISNESFHIQKSMCLIFDKDHESYSINELLLNANLEHISYNNLDFKLYNQYVAKTNNHLFCSKLNKEDEKIYRRAFPDLSFAEMQAINIYTGGAFSYMNMFLRRKAAFFDYPPEIIKATIIHSIMACSALAKLPERTIQETFRVENIPSPDEAPAYLLKRMEAAKTQAIIYLEGFVSTAVGNPTQSGEILYVFKNLKGKYIKPLSQCPHENEYLIPPTQIKIELYDGEKTHPRYKRFKHRFEVSTANELGHVPSGSLIGPTLNQMIDLTLYKVRYFLNQTQDKRLKKSLQKALNAFDTLSQIIKENNSLKDDQLYTSILDFNYAIEDYINEQNEVTKTHILYTKIQPILPQPTTSLNFSFLTSIFASSYIKPLAISLIILGFAGLVVGSCGIAGVISLGLTVSIFLASISLGSFGIGGIMYGNSFFAFKPAKTTFLSSPKESIMNQ